MRRNEQVWWVSATVLSLGAFSFFAGLGIRGLYDRLTNNAQAASLADYPRVASADARRVPEPGLKPAQLYYEVLKKLQLYYVEPLPNNTKLSYGSIDAMLNSLNDPNTRILTRTEVDALRGASQGEFPGLGAMLTIERYSSRSADDAAADMSENRPKVGPGAKPAPAAPANPGIRTLTVVSVAPGSPADKAGLQSGDHITEYDGHWIAPAHVSYRVLTQLTDDLGPQDGRPISKEDLPEKQPEDLERDKARKEADQARTRWKNASELPTVLPALLGGDTGEHELTVERGVPAKTFKVKVTFGPTRVQMFESKKLNAATGYVRLLALTDETKKSTQDALASFQQEGVKNLVVDLRGNAGGTLESARGVAGLILGPSVKFAELKRRGPEGKLETQILSTMPGAAAFKPAAISVLVDGGTSGSSELLAAALRDQAGARLVGTTTFGDGKEQEVVTLDNGMGVSITRAEMLTSKKAAFDGVGLKPDAAPQGDPLDAAVKALPGGKGA